MAAYAIAAGVIRVVLGTMVVAQVAMVGATHAVTTDVIQVRLGITAVASCVHRLSGISIPTGVDGGGIMTLSEGGATSPSSFDELDTTS